MRESLEMLQFITLSLTGLAAIEARVNFTDGYCSDFNKTPPPESEQPGLAFHQWCQKQGFDCKGCITLNLMVLRGMI